MAKIRARPETGTLYLDFFYRGLRCREQTALPDTAENRRKVQALLNRIEKEISQGRFDYAATFPSSPRAAQFAAAVTSLPSVIGPTVETPLFSEFAEQWYVEMSPQWRRLHRDAVRDVLDRNLFPTFGNRQIGEITKADVLAFRADIAKLPGRGGSTMGQRPDQQDHVLSAPDPERGGGPVRPQIGLPRH